MELFIDANHNHEQIKSDVQKQGEFVNFLIKEVESASFADISEVERFVKWLDGELSSLVDERSVLKHFPQWPEKKADALREAACSYRDLKNLESEVSLFEDNPIEAVGPALKRMQALQDRRASTKLIRMLSYKFGEFVRWGRLIARFTCDCDCADWSEA